MSAYFAEYLKRQRLEAIDALGELLRLDEERARIRRAILVANGRECRCPVHPECHRVARANRRYCSTCSGACGPFTDRSQSR